MKNVYIIDEYAISRINGIGTYITELIYCLKELDVNVNLVSSHHETRRFKILFEDGVKKILIPHTSDFTSDYTHLVVKFLRLYIVDNSENIFLVNYSPCENLILALQKSFPLSKRTFVIHDLSWTRALLGNKHLLKKMIHQQNEEIINSAIPTINMELYEEEKRTFNLIHKVICLTEETKELIIDIYGAEERQITVIPNGLVDNAKECPPAQKAILRKRFGISEDERLILYVGRINEVKGAFNLINSLKIILQSYSECRLIIAGTIFDAQEITKIAYPVSSKITFTGHLPKDELINWYHIADIGVLPSYVEQSSYTGIEMMMHGLPVVASDGFCVREMFMEGVNARIAKIGDTLQPSIFIQNPAKILLELLESPALCKEFAEKARKYYDDHYKITYMQKLYKKFIYTI